NELTAHAEELSPEAAKAVRSLRETLTSLVALGTAADLQIADMERTMEEFEAIFYSGDVSVSARLLRRHLTPEQRAELARLIIEPYPQVRGSCVLSCRTDLVAERSPASSLRHKAPARRQGASQVAASQSSSAARKASGCSYCGRWPESAISR